MWSEILRSILGGIQGGASAYGQSISDKQKLDREKELLGLKTAEAAKQKEADRAENFKYDLVKMTALNSIQNALKPGKNTPKLDFGASLSMVDPNDPDLLNKILGGLPIFGDGKIVGNQGAGKGGGGSSPINKKNLFGGPKPTKKYKVF